jgi:PKD repeat protein
MRVPLRFFSFVLVVALAGCSPVEEVNEPPSVGFEFSPQTPSAGTEVTFTAEATDPDGTIASFEWEFGDGGTASGRTTAHTYDDSGSYTVTVTVTDNRGATDEAQQTVEVQ